MGDYNNALNVAITFQLITVSVSSDCPSIVSGSKLAYFEPQEKIWKGEAGKMFEITDVYHMDALQPFQGLCEFSPGMDSFPDTIFRFPLRTAKSEISDNIYTLHMLRELLDTLRKEAKILLLFLRSVINIEVYELNESGRTLSFGISIQEQAAISHQRSQFMEQLSAAHASHSSGISQPVQLLSEFHVNVSDQHSSEPEVSHWLVFTRVGSTNHEVLRLAQAQKTLPWVGAALELHPSHCEKYPTVQGGRIFCFLPMPIEASSPFPIHINGTFSLSDDRRSLKWSGPERQNDPTAKWNEIVVASLLPQCYIELLMSAQKYLKHNEFYLAWPEVSKAKGTPWESLLRPFFTFLFCKDVVWTEKRQALQVVGEWIQPRNGIFIPQGKTLPSVIHNALSNSNVKLVSIPPKVWAALQCSTISVTEVNPSFARNCLRMNKHSYANIDRIGKFEILRYCLSDRDYNDLQGLCLLPLADKISWVDIVRCSYYSTALHYLCTGQCPAFLLPNQQHILVDVLGDEEVQRGLMAVARSGTTQLRELTVQNVAQLLPKSFPGEWQSQQIVSVPHFQFPTDWFEKFWKWVGNKALSPFAGQPLIPVHPVGSPPVSFQVVRLNKKSNILYIPQHVPTPQELLSALDKLRALYSKQVDFPFLAHVKLTNYLAVFNSNGILDAINCSPHTIQQVSFSKEEANSMKVILVTTQPSLDASRQQVLQNLKLFTTMTNSGSKLCSVSECASSSLLRAAIKVPANFFLRIEYFPSNALIFSDDYHQTVLLGLLQSRGLVSAPNNANFLLQYIFPLIPSKLGRNVLNSIMEDVLNQLPLIRREGYLPKIVSALKNLRFIEDKLGIFHSPSELYDPSINELQQLFLEEPVFPVLPFGEEKYLFHLRDCGLCQSVQPQDIVNIVSSIALPRAAVPQKVGTTKLSRARAVLKYIAGCTPYLLQSGVTIPGYSGTYTFQSALQYFASNRSWLPVCSSPPKGYPQGLVWKGGPFNSHFFSHDTSTLVLSTENSTSLPLITGSQVYVVYTQVSSQTSVVFSMDKSTQVMHVIAHFKEVIRIAEQVPAQEMERFIHSMYNCLNIARQTCLQSQSQLQALRSIPRWIWLKKKHRFISPNLVAAEENETFAHKLEPHIFLLPDELSQYIDLFVHFGMPRRVSNSQIVSVLQTIKSSDQTVLNPKQTWEIVMSILNWLTKYGVEEASLPDGCTLYVPIESDSETPVLMDADEVAYTDNAFLKTYLASVETEESYTCVHERIYPNLAHCLGLSSLSDYLDITEDTFEDAGQYEPLTVRLKNILRDYKEGLTIVKELLQNADDAEATEVNICYDARTIQVNSKALFFPGMVDAHGPALVVHNNAVFSKDDMENITKLAGATKQDKPLKIGKFGIGFCSVYHITDVPSFVSQDTLCIFDPTLSYLRKEIKNPARPGKRVKFTAKLLAASEQLAPYNGLFGFRQSGTYQGTLFRFPFRTHASELSSTMYSETMVSDLQSEIIENASKLLLFLQNVKKITFSRINQGDQSPTTLLEVEKCSHKVPQAIANTIESKLSDGSTTSEKWLVTTKSDTVQCKSATASVACQLTVSELGSTLELPKPIQGEVFCFLPLALKTGLPVHISANFAVMNNRRGIWTSDGGSRETFEVEWNVELMKNVIPSAYYKLLLALKELDLQRTIESYEFYSLWPLESHHPWSMLSITLYASIQSSELFYSSSVKQWLAVNKSSFLSSDILSMSSSNISTPQCVLDVVQYLQLPVVSLPKKYKKHLHLTSSTVTEEIFARLFFENIDMLKSDQTVSARNAVLCIMLEVYAMELDSNTPRFEYLRLYLRNNPCLPCVPDGKILRLCSSVVDSDAPFASLFDSEESMFPIHDCAGRQLGRIALLNLGMYSDFLPWSHLIERAQTIQKLYDTSKVKALCRTQGIIECIEITSKKDPDERGGFPLSNISFLPVMPQPKGYPLQWYGKAHQLICGNEVILEAKSSIYGQSLRGDVASIAGSQVLILNTNSPAEGGCGNIPVTTCEILDIRTIPSVQNVVDQLRLLISMSESACSVEFIKWSDRICRQAYDFLSQQLQLNYSDETQQVISELRHSSCIWTGKHFVNPQVVAKEWMHETGPYLFKLPSQFATKKDLTKLLGIKERFTLSDIASALNRMKKDYEDRPVEHPARAVLMSMIREAGRIMVHTEVSRIEIFMLPDTIFVMHRACDLSYNDAPWCKLDEKYILVTEEISRLLALKLGVKPVRSHMLDKYIHPSKFTCLGTKFGQREELTRRIQNILREYPFDITVLKELLQNADDAKATKVWVILDKRTHSAEGILSDRWNDLQGPALLVWNDSTFSEKDLDGIQRLGLGSKRSESETIGQYGIGFNVVYHLTDCPSFISAGETLCVFDPHCHYVDGAELLNPGRRIDVKPGFWNDFPGMKSSYLRDNLPNLPTELLEGSLFRFPLRHTTHHIQASKILDHTGSPSPRPLTADTMHKHLKKWAPDMKKALLFLNNVKELQFLVIEQTNASLEVECTFQVHFTDSEQAIKSHDIVHTAVTAFTQKSGSTSCVERYHITTTESHSHSTSSNTNTTECWLIQQGVGDIADDLIHWEYISQVKPRHGIAVQLPEKDKRYPNDLDGEVFCFLPLPIKSNLPVHVNGHFVLDASRRGLWKSTQPDHVDNRAKWNDYLLNAISSSYARLLIHAHEYFLSQQPANEGVLEVNISHYYNIFPRFSGSDSNNPEGIWRVVAEDVYKKLAHLNAPILAAITDAVESLQEKKTPRDQPTSTPSTSITGTKHSQVKWHKLHCKANPSAQVHFFRVTDSVPEKTLLRMILLQLGMTITSAPLEIKHHFDRINVRIPATDPQVVFKFYITYCSLQESSCHITSTPFQNVTHFVRFTRYVLRKCEVTTKLASNFDCYEFYEKPDGYHLLLTADCVLRRFTKVIQSHHCSIFPKSQNLFLHSDLLKLKLKRDYFFSAIDSKQDFSIVKGILSEDLPSSIKARKVPNSAAFLSHERVKALWACIGTDPVFLVQLDNILKHWALLLTTENELFSCPNKECLLPVMKTSDHIPMHSVLQQLGMPFLAPGVITDDSISKTFCPTLHDHVWMLHNILYLHEEHDIVSFLSHEILRSLLSYLSNISFKSNVSARNSLRSLPVFESIDKELTSLSDITTYIWPYNVCSVGREKWLQEQSVIFLHPNGLWREVGSGEEIGVCTISAEEVYVKYIFPSFHKMTEDERYKHLHHIRDHLFGRAEYNSTSLNCNIMRHATHFISELKVLSCIGRTFGETLKCISYFHDQREEIFTAFPYRYHFLPEKLYKGPNVHEESKSMNFFCKLGLKQSVSKGMFLELCKTVACGEELGANKASSILLRYMLPLGTKNYISEWHGDWKFLTQVSQIEFVFVKHAPELEWIVPSCATESKTTLKSAALIQNKALLWTVKPLIELPNSAAVNYPQILKILGVIITPTPSDIITNIINISKSKFADCSLLDHYPEVCSKPNLKTYIGVVDALLQNFTFLHNQTSVHQFHEGALQQLSSCECIPVYTDPKAIDSFKKTFVFLVKPNCVLTTRDAEDYFPLLHQLPDVMFGCVPLLEKIGVMRTIGLKHFNTILTTAFEQSHEGKLDPNMSEIVKRAIRKMYHMLQVCKQSSSINYLSDDDITKALAPLYLPTTEGNLFLSTSLLYCDSSLYKNIGVDFIGTGLQILDIPRDIFGFWEGNLCSKLPEAIRPRQMSQCCVQELSQECTQAAQQSELALSLEKSISLPSLPKLLLLLVGQKTKDDDLRMKFHPKLETFLNNFCTQSVKKLKTNIKLTSVVPHRHIGWAKVDVHIQTKDDKFTLCLDSYLPPSMIMVPVQIIAHYLVDQIKLLGTTTESAALVSLQQAFEMALQGMSHNDHSMMLAKCLGPGFSLDSADIVFEADVKPRIGKLIPQTWHHRLDQDINNLYHSDEWVGYEDEDGHLIFAQVVCPVIPEGVLIPCAYLMRYKILVKEEDEEGIEVSSLNIFKFLKCLKLMPEGVQIEAQSLEVTEYEGTSVPKSSTLSAKEKIKAAKTKLCQQLRAIWTLPIDERNKAIKRLYLKWHPDKNLDMPDDAEEVFKFLLRQLERLEKGLPLEDPDDNESVHEGSYHSHSSTRSGGGSSYGSYSYRSNWRSYFREWDQTAHSHKQYSYSEAHFQRRYYGGGGGSRRGGERWRGGGGGGWWGSRTGSSYYFDSNEDFTRPSVNLSEGKRWLKQAEKDHEVLCVNHCQMTTKPELANHVCFLAHQVAEKALKGGKYILCGLGENGLKSHSLTDHACALQMEKHQLQGLPALTAPLESYYLDTRYPNRVPPPHIPSERFTVTEADEAKSSAERVLEMMRGLI